MEGRIYHSVLIVASIMCLWLEGGDAEQRKGRRGKFLNVFQLVTFPNGPCQGSGIQNGTCYSEAECNSRGGTNGGTCAAGFGVCCIITVTCGQSSSENCTYFDSSGVSDADDGCCVAEICPCGDHICQLRLDFDSFMISGPSTSTASVTARRKNGGDVTTNVSNKVSTKLTTFGQCLTDSFSVGNPDGPNPPTICGINTGQHMYVEMSDCCNKLSFALGQNAMGTNLAMRSWSIKATQYSCKHPNLAPQGCTQYFFDDTFDTVQTFNYNNGNGAHLANQDQQICVRRERNFCRICWTTVALTDFAISGSVPDAQNNPNLCCDYGLGNTATKGFDCIQIPFAVTFAMQTPHPSAFCGNNMGLNAPGKTICSNRTPFSLNFRSDKWEPLMEASIGGLKANNGFMLVYFMDNMGCNPAGITG